MKAITLLILIALISFISSYLVENPVIEKLQSDKFKNNAFIKNVFWIMGFVTGVLFIKLMEHFFLFLSVHH